jgi:hypothetical protein
VRGDGPPSVSPRTSVRVIADARKVGVPARWIGAPRLGCGCEQIKGRTFDSERRLCCSPCRRRSRQVLQPIQQRESQPEAANHEHQRNDDTDDEQKELSRVPIKSSFLRLIFHAVTVSAASLANLRNIADRTGRSERGGPAEPSRSRRHLEESDTAALRLGALPNVERGGCALCLRIS